ncbi:hypothetical protein A3B60_04025 [Candidatus Peregrinibacteria bacterium RIFCSPLOWO2_01_FULL_39_12]|nr:MAG: hypothetical protein A3I58_01810 [Candidatus Peregrinibacteria bacterium RIFCSPLOWO2_02_FULL_39_10]OGJ42940.1 MAG: hypothetical protein A3B60_04025 [Candidatus Peregrinibacteria bacterium RIFCSPLOWO2_01_FULL_39_12]
MKMRFLSVLLTVAVILSSFSITATAGGKIFGDVEYGDANYAAISYLQDAKVVQGYADGTFKPGNSINRAEFLKIVMEASGKEFGGENCYKDVKDEWFAKYVCGATELGLVSGYGDKTFKPGQDINFAEASKIIANTLGLEISEDSEENWYQKYVTTLEDKKAIPKEVYSFDYKVKRGDMAEMIWRVKEDPDYVSTTTYIGIKRKEKVLAAGGALQQFESCVELKDYIAENASLYGGGYGIEKMMTMSPMTGDEESVSEDAGSVAVPESSAQESPDYSSTNVQVEGVDEADIVKTDGEYIYLLKDNTIRVVKAYPVSEMVEMDEVSFENDNFYPTDMYVDSDRLVVIGSSYGQVFKPMNGPSSNIYVFDITNKGDIKLIRNVDIEGGYTSSRKVDDMLYVVANKSEYVGPFGAGIPDDGIIPLYSDTATEQSKELVGCGDVRYIPGVEAANYLIIIGLPLDDPDADFSKEVVMGASGNIYASKQNLYVAESRYNWFFDASDEEKTIVHKFSLGKNALSYLGKGEVPGHILNQFSMDEYNGNFRVATTVGEVWNTEKLSTNNLYILDSELDLAGNITGIAPGEKIYSVRFVGDRAYMVTFKKVDPFFVLDVSDPKNPQILGKLKIPGYSDYLHPYDDTHIIGFGKEAVDASEEETNNSFDFAWYQGMKIAMFDVTDVSNPKELHKIVIGDRGTDSELLHNHKALLFDKEKGLMAFPVTVAEIPESVKADLDHDANTYGDYVFQGAYVYGVSVENGFEFKGKVSHYSENEIKEKSGYYWGGDGNIDRILYIGDYLYTVSRAKVWANKLADLVFVKGVDLKLGSSPEVIYSNGMLK